VRGFWARPAGWMWGDEEQPRSQDSVAAAGDLFISTAGQASCPRCAALPLFDPSENICVGFGWGDSLSVCESFYTEWAELFSIRRLLPAQACVSPGRILAI
jgi:hypothetical protein